MDKEIFNYNKLRGRIKEKFGSESAFAFKLGLNRGGLSRRLNNQIDFTQREILQSSELLDFEPELIPLYFFCIDGSETRTNSTNQTK